MYERFTDRARVVMQLANQEAQRFGHDCVFTEHILIGLVKEGCGVAAHLLKNMDIDLRKVRIQIEKTLAPGKEMVAIGKLPMTPGAKKVIAFAIEEAKALQHNYIGTEHLLLGIMRSEEAYPHDSRILMNLGLNCEDLRDDLLHLLGHDKTVAEQKAAPKVEALYGSEGWHVYNWKTQTLYGFPSDQYQKIVGSPEFKALCAAFPGIHLVPFGGWKNPPTKELIEAQDSAVYTYHDFTLQVSKVGPASHPVAAESSDGYSVNVTKPSVCPDHWVNPVFGVCGKCGGKE